MDLETLLTLVPIRVVSDWADQRSALMSTGSTLSVFPIGKTDNVSLIQCLDIDIESVCYSKSISVGYGFRDPVDISTNQSSI